MLSESTYPAVIGDRAIIESPVETGNPINSFIFPLSKSETFIYKDGANKARDMEEAFYITKNIAMLASADRYAACADRAHLEFVIEKYELLKSLDKLKNINRLIFDMID